MITFGSGCSGIEAASVAWEPIGFKPVWFSQFDPEHDYNKGPDYPSAVLQHHWPHIPNLGDLTTVRHQIELGYDAPDVFVAGTPCQAYSVAGMRAGLSDERGALTLEYVKILDTIDEQQQEQQKPACIGVWENVPGVLSSADNAFGCLLGGLAGSDCELEPGPRPAAGKGSRIWRWCEKTRRHLPRWTNAGCVFGPKRAVAWRVLDAQYFGVAQRRRRVFVVASARKGFDPAKVLFECEGVRRDTPPPSRPYPTLDCGIWRKRQSNQWVRNGFAIVRSGRVSNPTITEVERLQGFPDGYTDIPYRGKPAADGHRYKALGNSKATPRRCLAWKTDQETDRILGI